MPQGQGGIMTEREWLARAGIEKTLAACTQAGDSRKADAYAGCFTEDGILDLAYQRYDGRDAIRGFMAAPSVIPQISKTVAGSGTDSAKSSGFVSHHLTTCRIELTSAIAATVRTYWLVTTAVGLDHNGYYDDRFRLVNEDWLIEYRRPRTLWRGPDSLIG
jgi:SnoaL-like domain